MKFSFSDKFVKSNSFIDLCNAVKSYDFDGVEISDVEVEKDAHLDSIFRASVTADAKRKLVNRHISIPAICYPKQINEKTDSADIVKYVEYAVLASVSNVVITFEKLIKTCKVKEILLPAIKVANASGVNVLIETSGELAKTQTELYFAKNKKSTSNNQDLIDAVKKGMMAAHPDRGGKQEDFVRFHKVYKELKGEH